MGDRAETKSSSSIVDLTEFLEYVFKERQVRVRTRKNYLSTIVFHWKSEVGYTIPEDNPVITDSFRSYAREKPVPKKHVVDWDVCLILNFFQSDRFANWGQISDR